MAHVSQASSGNGQCEFIEEIETTLTSNDGISIFVRAWIAGNPQRVLVCVQGLGGHGGYYRELACQVALKGTIVVAPDLLNLPLLVLLGGRDYVARRSDTSAFLRRVTAREQRIVTFPQAYHCLLRDPDTPAVVRVLNVWLAAHQGKWF